MTRKPWVWSLALVAGLALAGCPDDSASPAADAGCDPADPECAGACEDDSDCGDPRYFACLDGVCQKACTDAKDCEAHPGFEDGPWPGCAEGLGCTCDERVCQPKACSSDSECSGQVCKAGACVAPDAAADACKVFPDFMVLGVGQSATFEAVAYKGGERVNLGAGSLTWEAVGGAVESVGAGEFKGKAATSGAEAAIKATFKGGISCTAQVQVFAPVGAGQARVILVDEMTGRLIADSASRDVAVIWGAAAMTESSTKGVFTADASSAADVSVFHEDFQYVSLLGNTERDLLIPLRRNPGDKQGGFKGKFLNFPAKNIALGFAGTSIPGGFTDLDLQVIAGPMEDATITFSNNTFPVQLPSGMTLGIGSNLAKGEYKALGVPGVCASESDMATGSCGTRSTWGLMTELPLDQAAPIISDVMGGKGLDLGKAIAALVPNIKNFKSAASRDLEFKLKTGAPDFSKTMEMKPEMSFSMKQKVKIPTLVKSGGKYLDGVVVLSGAMVAGRGFVPLGLSGGLDTFKDTKVDFSSPDGKVVGFDVDVDGKTLLAEHDGFVRLRMAPAHSGLEGSRYAVLAVSIPTTGFLPSGALGTSGIAVLQPKIPYGDEVKFPGAFLEVADGGKYDYRDGKFTGLKMVSGATVRRLVFATETGRRWMVYYGSGSFTVPSVPEGFEDRTMLDGGPRKTSQAPGAMIVVQAMTLAGEVDQAKLFGMKSNPLAIADLTHAFSVYDATPSVAFSEPAAGDVKSPFTTVKVRVANVEVPADAKVECSTGAQRVVADALVDRIATCTFPTALAAGQSHTIKARLVDPANDAEPLDPPVEAEIVVNVQP